MSYIEKLRFGVEIVQNTMNEEPQEINESQIEVPSPKLSVLPPPEYGWKKKMLIRLMWLSLIAAGLWYSYEGAVVLLVLFIAVVPFEKLFPRHKGQKIRRPQLHTDISYALIAPLMAVASGGVAIIVAIISLAWIPGLLIRDYVAMIPPDIAPFIGFALFDFTVYWTHRFYHEIPVLWEFHAIHHSTEDLDWVSGFRGHPFDGTLIAPAFIFLIAAGFSPELTGIFVVAQILLGLFLHANVKWRIRPLHRLVITPEFHHWHHSNEKDAIWTNYSTFLPIWDIIFGTYRMPKDKRPQIYGVDEYIPDGVIEQLRHPLRNMGNPLRVLRHPLRSIKGGFLFSWYILGQMKKSAFRPRGSKPEDFL